MNLERILATLKRERHGIDEAIAALEKVRSAESSGQGQGTAKKKQRSKDQNGRETKGETQERNRREDAKVVTLAPVAKRVS
jgi:hypothetical protein